MTVSISALVSARDSHSKPDIFYIDLFSRIDFYIAEKIVELTDCENKSLKELLLFNLKIFLFRVWFQKDIKQRRSVQ